MKLLPGLGTQSIASLGIWLSWFVIWHFFFFKENPTIVACFFFVYYPNISNQNPSTHTKPKKNQEQWLSECLLFCKLLLYLFCWHNPGMFVVSSFDWTHYIGSLTLVWEKYHFYAVHCSLSAIWVNKSFDLSHGSNKEAY